MGKKRSDRLNTRKLFRGGCALLLSLCLMLALPPGLAAEETPTFVIEAPEALPDVGEEFTVAVRAEHNPGFHVVQFLLAYPTDALTCREMALGELVPPGLAAVNPDRDGMAALGAVSLEPVTGDGVLAYCTFVVNRAIERPEFHLEEALFGDEMGEVIPFQTALHLIETAPPPDKPSHSPSGPSTAPKPSETPEPSAPIPSFTDTRGHWGEDFICQAVELGLFQGYGDGTFRPDEAVSRAQFVTVLWRLSGSPQEESRPPFTDISGQYIDFQKAIAWGYARGLVKGASETAFCPENTLTRQEAMTILHRLSGGQTGMEAVLTGIYDSQFPDSGDLAPWAKAAVYWGVYHELIQGTGGGRLAPTGTAGRAQIAKIVVQYQKMTDKGGEVG